MKAMALRILGAIAGLISTWRWGKIHAEKQQTERERDEAIKKIERYKKVIATPHPNNPFLKLRDKDYK